MTGFCTDSQVRPHQGVLIFQAKKAEGERKEREEEALSVLRFNPCVRHGLKAGLGCFSFSFEKLRVGLGGLLEGLFPMYFYVFSK